MSWHPEPIGAGVRAELGRAGGGGPMADVVAAWPAAVGRAIAENAWPARFGRDGTLHVAVSSSVWAFELTQLEATVRERLREKVTADPPARLRFAVGPLPERVETPTCRTRTVRDVSAAARRAGEEIAAAIENDELRALVAKAAAASLERSRERRTDRRLW